MLESIAILTGIGTSCGPPKALKNDKCKGCAKTIPYVTQYCFRAGNRDSGQDFGLILIRKT